MSKRLFDLFFSFFGLLVLWPLFVVVAALIVLDDGFPVFFRQERVGRYGKPFKIWKFRTMKVQNDGPQITVAGDKRITRVGEVLRRYKIDELPQLLNVLVGEMSFVGPRPEVKRYVDKYTPEQKNVLSYKPGITSPATVFYKAEEQALLKEKDFEHFYMSEVMPNKIKIDCKYFQNSSVRGDLALIFKTVFTLSSKTTPD